MTHLRRAAAVCAVLALAAVAVGSFMYGRPSRPVLHPAGVGKDAVSVFLPDDQGRLTRKMVEVRKTLTGKERADTIFRELKDGRAIPDRLRLYDLAVGGDGVLYLNVSKEFIDPASPGREITMVYGIVDSFLASFPEAKRVQLLVEGAPVYTRSGLLYILEPLQFNGDLTEE